MNTGKLLSWPARQQWFGHTGAVLCMSYLPSGIHVVTGSSDQTIRIWDAETGAAVGRPLVGHDGEVLSVACSGDGRRIISGSSDRTIRIWDAETGAAVGRASSGTRWRGAVCCLLSATGGASSPDLLTGPFEYGMPRLVLQLAGL
jgi:WD40 repeat protein